MINLLLHILSRWLHFELAVIQFSVEPILLEEIIVAALLNDVALTHHQDQIGVTDG